MLPRQHRLTRPRDFSAVLRGGRTGGTARTRRAGTPLVVVYRRDCAEAPERLPRAGFVVSKAVGNSVVRHRVTRRLRHIVCDRLRGLPAGTDLVIRANPEAATATSRELAAAVDRALEVVAR